jgi:N-acetylated-alpha-linked acidic dipeptidase
MADADVLPLDDKEYGQEIRSYLEQARSRAIGRGMTLDFGAALAAAERFEMAGAAMLARQTGAAADRSLDGALVAAERALLLPGGLPRRPWYRHSVYAPGEFTGYAAVVIPGVNEAIDAKDAGRAQVQVEALALALGRAADALNGRPQAGARGAHGRGF